MFGAIDSLNTIDTIAAAVSIVCLSSRSSKSDGDLFHVAIEWMRVRIVEMMENETTARITNQLKVAAMKDETTARLIEHVEAAARRIDGRYLRWEQQLPMVLFFALILLALLLLVLIIQIKGLSVVGILSTMYLASLLSRYVSHVM